MKSTDYDDTFRKGLLNVKYEKINGWGCKKKNKKYNFKCTVVLKLKERWFLCNCNLSLDTLS